MTTYELQDNLAKILIESRLKGRAEWFCSRPEYIEMSANGLLLAMKAMFSHRPDKLTRRREFEA